VMIICCAVVLMLAFLTTTIAGKVKGNNATQATPPAIQETTATVHGGDIKGTGFSQESSSSSGSTSKEAQGKDTGSGSGSNQSDPKPEGTSERYYLTLQNNTTTGASNGGTFYFTDYSEFVKSYTSYTAQGWEMASGTIQ